MRIQVSRAFGLLLGALVFSQSAPAVVHGRVGGGGGGGGRAPSYHAPAYHAPTYHAPAYHAPAYHAPVRVSPPHVGGSVRPGTVHPGTVGGGHVTPGGGHVTPGGGHVTPGGGHVTPGGGHVTPGGGHVTPGGGHVTPGGGHGTVVHTGGIHYTQKNVTINNRTYVQRTYLRHGVEYRSHYSPYSWGGRPYMAFYPRYHWYPAFYNYCYTPWARPWGFHFWWWYNPWYTPYVYYFQPYPVYSAPLYWLTDYVISDLLAAQYAQALSSPVYASTVAIEQSGATADQAQLDAAQANQVAAAQGPALIDDGTKDQLRGQVEATVKANEAQQPITLDQIFADPNHLFMVSDEFSASYAGADGKPASCQLTHGDLMRAAQRPEAGAVAASMAVVTSKHGNCAAGTTVTVSVEDLQQFQNDFAESVENGMHRMGTLTGSEQPQQTLQP